MSPFESDYSSNRSTKLLLFTALMATGKRGDVLVRANVAFQ
jgi:hypothetical protein